MVNDAAWIDQWWQTQDPTRTPRFDRYPFPGCASPWGQLDIGFIRLPHNGAFYAAPDSPSILLDDDLARAFPSNQKTIVYYDGPTKNLQICGETDYLANTFGGDNGIVYVFPQSNCHLTPIGNGASSDVAGHELLHNLGAVPDGAPNECPAPNTGHACDSTTDIMYPFLAHDSTLDSVILDFNHDDYYAHSGAWDDIQDSDWLHLLAAPLVPLALNIAGAGVVTSVVPGVACSSSCTTQWDGGTETALLAQAAHGKRFVGWTGGCTGRADCAVTLASAVSVTATFGPTRVAVAVGKVGKGTLTCIPKCGKTFAAGSRLTLHAVPAKGWRFASWTGDCAKVHAATCRPKTDFHVSARAIFRRR
jgi:hypothetical protein